MTEPWQGRTETGEPAPSRLPGRVELEMAGTFRTVFADAIRVLRTLIHEVLGAFFLALAVIGGSSVVQEYQTYSIAPDTGIWRIALAVAFSASMLAFGLHSFWKARKAQK